MQRLFSTFPDGWPGRGLLLLRVAVGAVLIHAAIPGLARINPAGPETCHWMAAGAGLLLLAGLWTPITGVLVAVIELWVAISQPGDPWAAALVGALGLGLAMLGPGAWSIDARLCGRKRIEIRMR